MNFGPYVAEEKLDECIVVGGKFKGNIILAKNRDRMYDVTLHFIHEMRNGVEVLYLLDDDTGWIEGINEHGIGLVNSALAVGYDEKEKKILTKKGKGAKATDSGRILAALGKDNIEDALKTALKHTGGIKGHTIISDNKGTSYTIESSSEHISKKEQVDLKNIIVRTNHGIKYKDAGYTRGKDYKSSKFRQIQAEKTLNGKETPEEVLAKLREQNYKKASSLNMRRDTNKMVTTSQMALDLDSLTMYIYPIEGKSTIEKIENKLPKDYTPKLSLKILNYDKKKIKKVDKND